MPGWYVPRQLSPLSPWGDSWFPRPYNYCNSRLDDQFQWYRSTTYDWNADCAYGNRLYMRWNFVCDHHVLGFLLGKICHIEDNQGSWGRIIWKDMTHILWSSTFNENIWKNVTFQIGNLRFIDFPISFGFAGRARFFTLKKWKTISRITSNISTLAGYAIMKKTRICLTV